jgi:hypothetical protein
MGTPRNQKPCPSCKKASGVLFYISRYGEPKLNYFRCKGCGYRWVEPVNAQVLRAKAAMFFLF